MAGGRARSFRFGDTDEKMAGSILSFIAFTTQVSREDDVGHDFICVLAYREENLLRAGPSFAVQVKSISQRENFIFDKPHACNWLENQEIPYFVCLVDRANLRLDLYSTWNIHNSYLWKRAKAYILVPGGPDDNPDLPYPRDEPECREEQKIPLGKPALSITMQDVTDEEKVEHYRAVLRDWISLERENILRKDLALKWIRGPIQYETNKSPLSPGTIYQDTTYWNAVDLNKGLLNFTQALASLRNMMNRVEVPAEISDQWQSKVTSLENAIKAFWDDLQDIAKEALQAELGRNLVDDD